jgi:amino acid adenylation domain-containing protein
MKEEWFPLSFAQRMFWFLDQFAPDTPAYNLPRALKIKGELDTLALREAFRTLLRRHEVLRTGFAVLEGELFQFVLEDVDIDLAVRDLSSLAESERKIETSITASEEARKTFDLEHPPLLRLTLLCLGPREHVLILMMHHIITDGWSMSILFKEVAQSYGWLTTRQQPQMATLPFQYADFVRWQQEHLTEDALQPDLEYWHDHLRGCPGLLQLPSDRPRPAVQSHRGSIESFTIDKTLTYRIKAICAREGVTLYMGLLAAFQALLSRYTGTHDIPVGTAFAGRNDPELSALIGCFVNTLVIRGDLSGNPSFRELLRRTRDVSLRAFAHQEMPFEQLLAKLECERTRSHTPLFQIMFILQNAPKQVLNLPGLLIEEIELDSGLAKFDLTLEIVEQDRGLYCQLEYSSDLFERSTIQRMVHHFQNLILSAIEDPASPISKLNMLSASERKQIIFDWNATSAEYSKEVTIARAFEEQARRSPDAIALRQGVRTLTYRELDGRANQVARALIEKGVRPEMPVGIYMKRSTDAIVALLGVLKVGSPYVPLEPSQPKHRLHLLITACDCQIVLTHGALRHDLPEVEFVLLDADMALWTERSGIPPSSSPTGQSAYIIFTSGSTGVPNGVVGTHRATMNRLEWMYRTYPFSTREVCCQKTALSFVDSVWEIFGPLLRGVPNVVLPEEVVIDPELLLRSLARERVTRIVLVPTLLHVLLEHAPDLGARVPQLKLWTVSGEYLPVDLAEKFCAAFPEARLLNLYGSSEVAGDVTHYQVGELAGLNAIPIGKPISNTQVYVFDEFMQPLPIGVPGMLYVGGDCLSPGYRQRPDLTRERFISNPLAVELGTVFATGDRARWLPDGNLEYLGRLDTQTKIRGFRIELGEIEANLMAHPLVRQAVVLVTGAMPEARQLTAYVMRQDGSALSSQELREFLRTRLPAYMVPAFFVEIAEMPLLPSGKVDRRALPPPLSEARAAAREQIEPRDDTERRLMSIWRELLEVKEFGVRDNFFELGGNSLLAMQVLARVRKVFEVEVSIRSFFDGPSIEELGHEIQKAKASGAVPRVAAIVPRARTGADRDTLSAELAKLSPEQIEILLRQIRPSEPTTS